MEHSLKYDGGAFGRTQISRRSDDTFATAQRLGAPTSLQMKSLFESAW
jgi:hypothetical protein